MAAPCRLREHVTLLMLFLAVSQAPAFAQQEASTPKSFWGLLYEIVRQYPAAGTILVVLLPIAGLALLGLVFYLTVKRGRSLSVFGIHVGAEPKDEANLLAAIRKREAMIAFLHDTQNRVGELLFLSKPDPADFASQVFEFLQDRLGIMTQALSSAAGEFRRASVMYALPCDEGKCLRFIAAIGISDATKRKFAPKIAAGTIAGEAAHNQRTINVPDVLEDDRWLPIKRPPSYRSLLSVPIFDANREVIGVVNVDGKRANTFEKDDELFLEAFASIVGFVLQAVRGMDSGSDMHISKLLLQ